MRTGWLNAIVLAAVAITLVVLKNVASDTSTQLLNVSYDPTRELFQDLNQQFVDKYFKVTRELVKGKCVPQLLLSPQIAGVQFFRSFRETQ